MTDAVLDPRLLDAAIAVLAETGWEGVTLEKVAERAGQSRSTVWRKGVTRDGLLAALLDALADDFRLSMWPLLTSDEPGRVRLEQGLAVLCQVIERHLPLVLASDEVFHQGDPGRRQLNYLDPYRRFVRDGQADGTLAGGDSADEVAEVAFNCVAWTYSHLRGRHQWSAERAEQKVIRLVMHGLLPAS
ncbi:TetR/AcrR family transcriptional regulator [Asanoa ferruginea]|uniref:TetR/AcrR family transcriptional regulator n=1 Tax=Asanoa ferruginea TaxID=53367 RepID=UPI00194435E3|nr:TetR/AcrR family transcriptional regulator [Asanoa ferruginea]